jgi:hypothetical protein
MPILSLFKIIQRIGYSKEPASFASKRRLALFGYGKI